MQVYPYTFEPIYKDRIWGGQNLRRLFGRALPPGRQIGESWELADLEQGVSLVANGPERGTTLTRLTQQLGVRLLGKAATDREGRFPLLLKFLDANDILSLQVHPDRQVAMEIGPEAAAKTECWYVLESRGGFVYKGVKPGVTAEHFRQAIREDRVADLVRRVEVKAGDFHYLPAGTVHSLGAGVVVAEIQTPSDTTYRVSDWGRGRELHVDQSMRSIRFEPAGDAPPGAAGNRLAATEFFDVALRQLSAGESAGAPLGVCTALMILKGAAAVVHDAPVEQVVRLRAGRTVLLPAALAGPTVRTKAGCRYLQITLPGAGAGES